MPGRCANAQRRRIPDACCDWPSRAPLPIDRIFVMRACPEVKGDSHHERPRSNTSSSVLRPAPLSRPACIDNSAKRVRKRNLSVRGCPEARRHQAREGEDPSNTVSGRGRSEPESLRDRREIGGQAHPTALPRVTTRATPRAPRHWTDEKDPENRCSAAGSVHCAPSSRTSSFQEISRGSCRCMCTLYMCPVLCVGRV